MAVSSISCRLSSFLSAPSPPGAHGVQNVLGFLSATLQLPSRFFPPPPPSHRAQDAGLVLSLQLASF